MLVTPNDASPTTDNCKSALYIFLICVSSWNTVHFYSKSHTLYDDTSIQFIFEFSRNKFADYIIVRVIFWIITKMEPIVNIFNSVGIR